MGVDFFISQLPGNNTSGYFWSICKVTRSIFVQNAPTNCSVSPICWHMAFWKQKRQSAFFWHKIENNQCTKNLIALLYFMRGNQNLMMVFIQSRKQAILVITPGWFLLAHPIPHEIIPAKSNLPFSRFTAIGPPESP